MTTGAVLLFLTLPVVAAFLRVPPGELISALGSDAAAQAIRVTAETITVSMVLIIGLGTPAAYWIDPSAERSATFWSRSSSSRSRSRRP